MIRRLIQQNSAMFHLKFIRHISGIQKLCSNSHLINLNERGDDEDISEEVIDVSKQLSKDTRSEINSKKISIILAHASLTHKFRHFLHCSEDEAKRMISQNKRLFDIEPAKISIMIEFLFENEVLIKSIVENPWLLSMKKEHLRKKINRLKVLNPRNINDFVPFLQVSHAALNRVAKIFSREKDSVPEGNRIYYLSKRLNVDPALVSKYVATHLFMFEITFEMLIENLNIMMQYEIEPIYILRDLWAFKYYPKSISDRLERCKLAGKENLKPWMVRCPEEVLENSLKITQENKDLLGTDGVVEYISHRLGYDTHTVRVIVNRHPAVLKCRGTKVKEVLDYLLDVEEYEPVEVARVIRILTHSLETTKMRLQELRGIGCRPSSLSIVCRSQREYYKFIKEWIDRSEGVN